MTHLPATQTSIYRIDPRIEHALARADQIVSDVPDGETVVVSGQSYRLLWVDAPDIIFHEGRAARDFLAHLLPVGARVALCNAAFGMDVENGKVLVVREDGLLVQDAMIRAGWTPIRIDDGLPPTPWAGRWLTAQRRAEIERRGCWATAAGALWIRKRIDEMTTEY